jgi:hypothetical protein
MRERSGRARRVRARSSFWEAFWEARVWMRVSCSVFCLISLSFVPVRGVDVYLARPWLRASLSRSRWGIERSVLDGRKMP